MPADIALTIFNLKKINCRPKHVKKHKRKKIRIFAEVKRKVFQ